MKPAQQQNIKGELRGAVRRLRTAKRIAHKKSYAIATYLREVDDTHVEPSLVAFVDPKRGGEALSYNGLVQSWPEIARLVREGGKLQAQQADLFGWE